MKNLLVFLISVSIFSASCKSSTSEKHDSSAQNHEVSNSETVHLGGTLRQSKSDPTKWCWISDSKHTPVGFDDELCGTASGNKITLPYGFSYSKVITLVVTPDESLASMGMTSGASVGLDYAVISFFCHGSPCSMDVDTGFPSANLWVSGMMVN